MSITATRHNLPTATGTRRTREMTTVGQWDFTARSGEALRVVAVNSLAEGPEGVASEVYEFNRKELHDSDLPTAELSGR
jgi:hypothetical protein